MLILTKESGGKADAVGLNRDKNGNVLSQDTGLMQINSIHGFNPDQLKDPDFNIRQGIGILADSIKAHKGDLRAGVKGYNGAGPQADAYANDVLSKYNALTR